MWKAFAIFYVLSLAFGLVIGATLLLGLWDEMAYGIKILGSVSLVMALATAIGLVAYAFNLHVPPFGLWRPYSWFLGILLGALSVISVVRFAAQYEGGDDLVTLLWLSLSLLVNYFSWLGVWRYGRRMKATA
ncbi:hypothetical protein [Ensifer adhaerens]|uniref:hypothetical protein n=1 Tax=Ensifer adhaerens TaxID=106592 RepID=UPI00098EA6D8|nr:hypothetical protein [Ensifer adhaerens]